MAVAAFALAGLQLAGGYFAADNVKKTAQLNEDIANMNAEFAELDAFDAELDGFTQIARYQSVIDATLADQTVSLAAQDVQIGFGSAGELAKESRFIAELNKMEIEKQAQEKALGFKREAREHRLGGVLTRLKGEADVASIQISSLTGAASTALSGYQREQDLNRS